LPWTLCIIIHPEDSEKLKAFLHVTKCIENKNLAFLPETVHLLAVEQVVY